MTNDGLTEMINIKGGIHQGYSLSPTLFNLIMDQIIEDMKNLQKNGITSKNLNAICYADGAILMTNNEGNRKMQLYKFNQKVKQ